MCPYIEKIVYPVHLGGPASWLIIHRPEIKSDVLGRDSLDPYTPVMLHISVFHGVCLCSLYNQPFLDGVSPVGFTCSSGGVDLLALLADR